MTQGTCFYITCIDRPELLEPLYEKYKDTWHCVYQQDIYTKAQWLEIMPKAASKSHAILQLKEFLECDREENQLDFVIMKGGMYPVFTINGTEYTAHRLHTCLIWKPQALSS